jgi:hypothetical protein
MGRADRLAGSVDTGYGRVDRRAVGKASAVPLVLVVRRKERVVEDTATAAADMVIAAADMAAADHRRVVVAETERRRALGRARRSLLGWERARCCTLLHLRRHMLVRRRGSFGAGSHRRRILTSLLESLTEFESNEESFRE